MKNITTSGYHGARTTAHGPMMWMGKNFPVSQPYLHKTKDQSYLDRWKARIGHEEAERIKNLSSKRGTSMHKFIEKHITGVGYDDLTKIGRQAKPMAQKIIDVGLTPVSEYYGSEVSFILSWPLRRQYRFSLHA